MTIPAANRPTLMTTMADGTIKQTNAFSGTQVWTVPGRGNRPLSTPAKNPQPLQEEDFTRSCAFCEAFPLKTPPEKSRIVKDEVTGGWRTLSKPLPHHLSETTAEFRRVPNLFEIVSYDYWAKNYRFAMDQDLAEHMTTYLGDATGHAHVEDIVAARLQAAGEDPKDYTREERFDLAQAYFGGGHDVIISRRHYVDGATDDSQLASSASLTTDEHYAFIRLTVESIADLYARNRYAPYVIAFQNWLAPAGASFEHLHKQLVAIDERGAQSELEIDKLRQNPNMFNEWAVDYAGYHNLIVAENDHAVLVAGVGHRYPTLEIYSKSATPEPWLQTEEEIRAMSDLIHAAHAATGPEVPTNEEWHHKPIDLDLPTPWRVNIKWRVSTLAGFEGGTKIYVNTLSPFAIRDRVVDALYRLREEGSIARGIRIATECSAQRNMLRYNPVLHR